MSVGRNGSPMVELDVPQVSMRDTVDALDKQIEVAKEALAQIDKQRDEGLEVLAQEKRDWLARINEGKVEIRSLLSRLERAKKSLGEEKLTAKVVSRRVVEALTQRGPLPQTELIREVGANSSQVSYAIQRLTEQGTVRDTGEKVGSSHVYSLGSAVVRPGD